MLFINDITMIEGVMCAVSLIIRIINHIGEDTLVYYHMHHHHHPVFHLVSIIYHDPYNTKLS